MQVCSAAGLPCGRPAALFKHGIGVTQMVRVGHGSASTKQRSKWAFPFLPGRNYTYQGAALSYADWLLGISVEALQLRAGLSELCGCALACECPPGQPCHGEVLAAAAAEADSRPAAASGPPLSSRPAHRWSDHWGHERAAKRRRLAARTAAVAALFAAGAATGAIPKRVPCRWPQESFQAAFRSLFPAGLIILDFPNS